MKMMDASPGEADSQNKALKQSLTRIFSGRKSGSNSVMGNMAN
jgi:hypothetical protein